jgi:hypothetical protein
VQYVRSAKFVQTRPSKRCTTSAYSRSTYEAGRWRFWGLKCPGNDILAGYVDGGLDQAARSRTESHLADCAACRSLVGDVVTTRRLEATPLPLGLKQRAIASTAPSRTVARWVLVPATAAGLTVILIAILLIRVPRDEITLISRSPVADVVAKSETPTSHGGAAPNIVRKSAPSESLPALIFPADGRVFKPSELIFKWRVVPHTRHYEIHVVTSEGDPVWESDSESTDAKLSPDITLKDGTYFVWITASLDDGRVQKSIPVRFVVNADQ